MQATYAVTVEALKHLPILQQLLERTQLVEQGQGLTHAVACVLAYEVLFGEGLRPTGPAERAVLKRKVGPVCVCVVMGCGGTGLLWILDSFPACLRVPPPPSPRVCVHRFWLQADLADALQQLLDAAGVQSAAELLPHPGPHTPHPRTARVNTIKMSVQEALDWLRAPPPEHRKWAAVVSWARLCLPSSPPHLPSLSLACPTPARHPAPALLCPVTNHQPPPPSLPTTGPAGRGGWAAARPAALSSRHRPARPPAGGQRRSGAAEQGLLHARPRAGAAAGVGVGGRVRGAGQQDHAPGGADGQPRQHRGV